MAKSDAPNKDRVESALSIYRSEMRQYISTTLRREYGPSWMLSTALSGDARERLLNRSKRQVRPSDPGDVPETLIDLVDIPDLIQGDRRSFDELRHADIDRMHWIRELHNELHHAADVGDCTASYADAVVGLCGLILERCGRADAVESIRQLSSIESGSGEGAPTTQREEGRHRRLARREREQIATTLPHSGVVDENRADRALLIYRAAMRRYIQAVLQREYGSNWIHQVFKSETQGHARFVGEHRLRMLDRGVAPANLIDVGDFPFVIQKNPQLFPDFRATDIAAMQEIRAFRNRLAHSNRQAYQTEMDRIVDLCSQVLERCGLVDEAEAVDRLSLPAFGDDIASMRRWFDADRERQQRHPDEYAALERSETSLLSRIFKRS